MLKKGVKISCITIDNGQMHAMDANNDTIKLSRNQRNILSNYKDPDYIRNIQRAFDNVDVIADDFSVSKDGELVFRK